MKRLLLVAAAGVVVTVLAATTGALAPAVAGDGPLSPELQKVRKAVARYHSAQQARRAGYVFEEGEPCVASPLGTMGVHVANPALIGTPAVDPLHPELLLYLPNRQGKLKLIGVEYFKIDADQNLATAGDRPSLFGRPFDGPMLGHAPGMPIHYDLHAWVAEANPSGVFAMFNPAISCP